MGGEQMGSTRQRILRRAFTLDEASGGVNRPRSRSMSGTLRRIGAGAVKSKQKDPKPTISDPLPLLKEECEEHLRSDLQRCSSASLTITSPPSSPRMQHPVTAKGKARFGLGFMTPRNRGFRRSLSVAINAAGWGGVGSSPEIATHTPFCTPPSPSETSSAARHGGFVKLAPWTRSRGKSFLTTPKSSRSVMRSSWRSSRIPRVTPDTPHESDVTDLCQTSTPSPRKESSEKFISPVSSPEEKIRESDEPSGILSPEVSPPRIERLSIDSLFDSADESTSDDGLHTSEEEARGAVDTEKPPFASMGCAGQHLSLDSSANEMVAREPPGDGVGQGRREPDQGVGSPPDTRSNHCATRALRSIASGDSIDIEARVVRSSRLRVRFLQPPPKRGHLRTSPPRHCGMFDEAARLRSLVAEDREWPWAGRNITTVQYVTLGGQHRWIRSEGCRNAVLLTTGSMFLVELPVEDLMAEASYDGAELPEDNPASRGWYMKIDAPNLRSISVPMAPAEVELWAGERDSRRSSGSSAKFPTDHGVIFHSRNGACVWVQCGSGGSRDALVRAVAMWHMAETKTSVLDIRHMPQAEAELNVRGGGGGVMNSLLAERKACSF